MAIGLPLANIGQYGSYAWRDPLWVIVIGRFGFAIMDKFVCGTCKVTYNSLEIFSSHKRVCQKVNASNDTKANALNSCVVSFQFVDTVVKVHHKFLLYTF